jgi:hypothetical protein
MYSNVLYLFIKEGSLFVELFVNCQVDISHPAPPLLLPQLLVPWGVHRDDFCNV